MRALFRPLGIVVILLAALPIAASATGPRVGRLKVRMKVGGMFHKL